MVAMAGNDTPIICNGFKDAEFIEMAMLAQKIGRQIIPVVEKYTELELILQVRRKDRRAADHRHARQAGRPRLRPLAIVRRLSLEVRPDRQPKSSARWPSSRRAAWKIASSCCTSTWAARSPTSARSKARSTRRCAVYVELHKQGAGLKYIDVGGGLGVDYDGSQTNFESSVNYTLQEYANDVVFHVQSVCDEASVPHPTIISESGRAVVAYHSVLVFGVLGVAGLGENDVPMQLARGRRAAAARPARHLPGPDGPQRPGSLSRRPAIAGHGAEPVQRRLPAADPAQPGRKSVLGHRPQDPADGASRWSSCPRNSKAWTPCSRTRTSAISRCSSRCPTAGRSSSCFPVMPIHRLNERPTRHAVLGDITCDSDGKIEQFIDRRDVKKTLPLHTFTGEPYFLGAFLFGAYQEILGDMHNLFGDTNAVHVSMDDNGEVMLETVIKGDTVREVLDYVEFNVDS